jgi:hypothetical protein
MFPRLQGMTKYSVVYNIGKLKNCSIDKKKDKKGMPQRLSLRIPLPLVYNANITLEKD